MTSHSLCHLETYETTVTLPWQLYLFSWEPALETLNSRDAEADEVKKSIAIFGNKQCLLSINMKTKVVQHVERECESDF